MSDIYQQLWNADQRGFGVTAIRPGAPRPPADLGHVVVNEGNSADSDHQLLAEVAIPDAKRAPYELCEELFNNYVLDQRKPDDVLAEEPGEVDALLDHAMQTEVMEVARLYAEHQTGDSYSSGRWRSLVHRLWFERYDMGRNQDLSGFEHIFVGEQRGSKLGGYHFWYKYHLDDTHSLLPHGDPDASGSSDDIEFHDYAYQGANASEGRLVPEVVTLKYRVTAFDYVSRKRRPLVKPIGGFFVGCSPEGLLALGAVRALHELMAPKEAVINRAKYRMVVHHSSSHKQIRSFYPEFRDLLDTNDGAEPGSGLMADESDNPADPHPDGSVDGPATPAGGVRILCALVNPPGRDPGLENVTLISTLADPVKIDQWFIEDKTGRREPLSGELVLGVPKTITLSGHGAQLSNRGGTITLRDAGSRAVHSVTYTRGLVSRQGSVVLF